MIGPTTKVFAKIDEPILCPGTEEETSFNRYIHTGSDKAT
jgi:hypothetical protein